MLRKSVSIPFPEPISLGVEKHVVSPLLVEAVSTSAQLVWANSKGKDGLLGHHDILFQSAVGLPVAVDGKGNMCVVVMFSCQNLASNDNAVEYLKFISGCAFAQFIPCLLPIVDKGNISKCVNLADTEEPNCDLGDGVVTRNVSLNELNTFVDFHECIVAANFTEHSVPKNVGSIFVLHPFLTR